MREESLRDLLKIIFRQGVHGDSKTYFAWCRMFINMVSAGLPDNLRDFENEFQKLVIGQVAAHSDTLQNLQLEEVIEQLEKLKTENLIESIEPYNEYRLKKTDDWIFSKSTSDFFFTGNELTEEPLQYIRSRSQNFYSTLPVSQEAKDELVIAMTEAAENAIKYSDRLPIIISHSFNNQVYEMRVYNSCYDTDLNDEIERGKFSEQVSLMRGVLVMSKLLDNLNLNRDQNKSRVEFVGKRDFSPSG